MTKIIYLLLLNLMYLNSFCNSTQLKTSNIGFIGDSLKNNKKILQSLIGKWSMCTVKSKKGKSSYNVCPIIIFYKDGRGEKNSGSNKKELFNWELKNDTLHITNHLKNDKGAFADNEYIVGFESKKDFLELEIKNIIKEYSYILRK